MHGIGTLEWPSTGRKYEGQMSNNMRDGNGTFKWGDGTVFNGGFKDDNRHGYGILKSKDTRD